MKFKLLEFFPEPSLKISLNITLGELNGDLLDDLNKLAPFGQENPEPIISLKNVRLPTEPQKVGTGEHFRFSIKNQNETISGIAWNMSDRTPPVHSDIDLAFKLKWNFGMVARHCK